MLEWDKVDERFYQQGLDRGVMYLRNPKAGRLVAKNYVYNSSAQINTNLMTPYGVGTQVQRSTAQGPSTYFVTKTQAGSQMGVITTVGATPGMSFRPASTKVTISALVMLPNTQPSASVGIYAFDKNSNDPTPILASTVTAGSWGWTLTPGVWTRVFVTGVVKAGRRLDQIGISKQVNPTLTDQLHVRELMVNDGDLMPFFDGDSPDTANSYAWAGTAYASESLATEIISGVPWSGLTAVDESSDSGASTLYYRDGVVYLADVDASDFKGSISAIAYPEVLSECIGIPQAADGLFVDNQKPKPFGFSYRTLIGSGTKGDQFGYQIHLVYNAMASIGSRSRKTLGADNSPVEFSFDIVATPVKLPGYRPTAHFVLDTRYMTDSTLAQLELMLYGNEYEAPYLPTPEDLFDLMHYGDNITVYVHTADKTYTVEGSNDNVYALDNNHFMMENINGTDNGDGTYTISDGGTTTLVIQ